MSQFAPSRLDPAHLSLVIITLNEEAHIGACIQSAPAGSEVIVVDSGSQDSTVEIAQKNGAKVYQRDFDDYATQKNYGLSKASGAWILMLDADERLSQLLCDAIVQVVSTEPEAGRQYFSLLRKVSFHGKLLNYGRSADSVIRLVRRGSGEMVGKIHEEFIPKKKGKLGKLGAGFIEHYSYADLNDYFTRFNRYTRIIAEIKILERGPVRPVGFVWRPWLEFINRYVVRLGFLDGYPGYLYALNASFYSFIKYAKFYELCQFSKQGKTD